MKPALFDSLRQLLLPNGKAGKPGGVSVTTTFNPNATIIDVPQYQDHLEDIFELRQNENAKALLKRLFVHDPDMSSALNAYLTVANTDPHFVVYNEQGEIDEKGHELLRQVIDALTVRADYKTGFQIRQTIKSISENMRYMALLRGAIVTELVLDKLRLPSEIRQIDITTLEFTEKVSGVYKPQQRTTQGQIIPLDVITVSLHYFHKDPTEVYSHSHFSASINTIAARQQVINTLYRIMNISGYPRITLKVLEEIVLKNASEDVKQDAAKKNAYVNSVLSNVSNQMSSLRPDQVFVHTDSIEPDMLNKGSKSGAEVNIQSVIQTLNDQNQAALKVMSTIIGRGDSGVNTSSTEARIFSMNADELNQPVAEAWEYNLTLALRLLGYPGKVVCHFQKVELRPDLELEPQRIMKQTRLQKDLSLGLISDNEYHMQMYNRLPPAGTKPLSGTEFLSKKEADQAGSNAPSSNSDPLGRSLTPKDSKSAKSKINNSLEEILPGQVAFNQETGETLYWTGKRWVDFTQFNIIGLEQEDDELDSE
jgi:hypothetical protein